MVHRRTTHRPQSVPKCRLRGSDRTEMSIMGNSVSRLISVSRISLPSGSMSRKRSGAGEAIHSVTRCRIVAAGIRSSRNTRKNAAICRPRICSGVDGSVASSSEDVVVSDQRHNEPFYRPHLSYCANIVGRLILGSPSRPFPLPDQPVNLKQEYFVVRTILRGENARAAR